MRLIQTLSEALARTRDAQQFQVQTEVALLTACDVEDLPRGVPGVLAPSVVAVAVAAPMAPVAPVPVVAAAPIPAAIDEAPASVSDTTLKSRWADVIDQVKNRNPILASLLGSAQPVGLQDSVLVVAFGTEFNRKSADSKTHRQLIESAFQRVYGMPLHLRCTVKTEVDGGESIQDDPVINYAVRTFGGEPRRLTGDT